jgi:hypothetical protein
VAACLIEIGLLQQLLALFSVQAYVLMQMIGEDMKKYLEDRSRAKTTMVTEVCLHHRTSLCLHPFVTDRKCGLSVIVPPNRYCSELPLQPCELE